MKQIFLLMLVIAAAILIPQAARADGTAEAPAPFPGAKSQWEGFDRYDFQVDGKAAIVVVPKVPLAGKPWLWRGEFFGAFANADAALVAKGFYLVYLGGPICLEALRPSSPGTSSMWKSRGNMVLRKRRR